MMDVVNERADISLVLACAGAINQSVVAELKVLLTLLAQF